MGRFMDLTGQRFGRLTVIERVESDRREKVIWRCRCSEADERKAAAADKKKLANSKPSILPAKNLLV
jgi:hypothetical protein